MNIVVVKLDGAQLHDRDTPELLDNVIKRISERATVRSKFLDGHGWLWAKCNTPAQAAKIRKVLHGQIILKRHRASVMITSNAEWPPGMTPVGQAIPPGKWNGGERGGIRHKKSSSASSSGCNNGKGKPPGKRKGKGKPPTSSGTERLENALGTIIKQF